MNRDEWLKSRRKGIGGSDSATILGVNPFQSRYELWLDKLGELEDDNEDNEAIYFGNVLEDIVAKEFTRRTSKKVERNNFIMAHRDYDFLRANIDRRIVGENALLECKTTGAFNKKAWEAGNIPPHYIIQVQHYMAVFDYSYAYIAVLIGGQQFKYKRVERSQPIIDEIIKQGREFYKENILDGNPPPITGSKGIEKHLNMKYDESDGAHIDLKSSYQQKLEMYDEIKDKLKVLQDSERAIKNELKDVMKEAETARVGKHIVKWKPQLTERIDKNKLKEKHPQAFNDVINVTSSRRMTIKKEEGKNNNE